MQRIIEFVRNGGGLSQTELDALIEERMLRIPARTQRNWLRQLLLALDGYGAPQHQAPSEQVRAVVKRLDASLPQNVAAAPVENT